jgi:glycosyltransferase involved in cell wall biosynthesis
MTIAFIHSGKAFLPDLEAYCRFFERRGVTCKVIKPAMRRNTQRDIDWVFMGLDLHRDRNITTIHEYCSSSIPPFRNLKDRFKKTMNARPDFRLFLNEAVRDCFSFTDKVPYGYRDIGLEKIENSLAHAPEKKTDFIYVGTMHNRSHFESMLQHVTTHMPDRTLLIIGNIPDNVIKKYQRHPQIRFEGPYSHEKVLSCIPTARYALNWMPDKPPFNVQSSLKFLEYVACGVPVITTDYPWVREFEQQYGGNYFFVSKNMEHFEWEKIKAFPYAFPDLKEWSFDQQVARSGVLEFLSKRFPDGKWKENKILP